MSTSPHSGNAARTAASLTDQISHAVVRVAVVLFGAALVARVVGHISLNALQIALLAAVLALAAAFGLVAALVGVALALVVYRLSPGASLPSADMHSEGALLLAAYGAAVGIVGVYTNVVRGQTRPETPLTALASEHALKASASARKRTPEAARRRDRSRNLARLGRGMIAMAIVMLGLAVALTLLDRAGLAGGLLLATGPVLLAAGLMGARFGLTAGISVGLTLAIVHSLATRGGDTSWALVAIDLALFASQGWGVGWLSDQLNREQQWRRMLAEMMREFAGGEDEAASWAILEDRLGQIVEGGAVEVLDERGMKVRDVGGSAVANQADTEDGEGWTVHDLVANGRDVGRVRWRTPGAEARRKREIDLVVISMADLAASSIVRLRQGAERAEIDYQMRAEQLRALLLDATSHHFRSPLAGILGSVTGVLNLPDDHDPKVRNNLLLLIKEQANRLSRYVDNFLILARLDSIEITPSDIDFEELISDIWDTFGDAGASRRYLVADLATEAIRSDAVLLSQVFGNLLENAIKYSPEASRIRVESTSVAGELHVTITDEGPGVQEASLGRMFDRFYRSPGAKAPGLGLGLYITRSLVEMLGGSVAAANRTDGQSGLTMTVILPIRERS